MLEKMTDLQFVLYVLAGISAVVLLQKIIVSLIYRHLKKETDGLPTVNDRWMKQLKLKYENTYKINSHMADTRLYVDRQVEKLKFFHAHLAGMNSFYRKAQLICILLGGTSYALAVRAGRTVADCHLFFVMGILAAVFLQLLDCLSGNERSEKIVKQNIRIILSIFWWSRRHLPGHRCSAVPDTGEKDLQMCSHSAEQKMGEVPGKDMPGESLIKEWQKVQEIRSCEIEKCYRICNKKKKLDRWPVKKRRLPVRPVGGSR